MFFCEYCEIFKSSCFTEDLFIVPFWNFYLIIDDSYFRFTFYYCKIRLHNRKNFAIDGPKFVFGYLIISLLQRFVCSSNCKEKLVALNWTILASNFSKYFSPKTVARRCSVEKVFSKIRKIHTKTTLPETLILIKLQASTWNLLKKRLRA